MRLSGSVYSWNDLEPTEAAQKLEIMNVDCFHIDCNDDPNVFNDIEAIKKKSRLPIDLHLITSQPQNYYDAIRDSGLEICCFQYENLEEPLEVPKDLSCRLGLAITMDTPIDVFEPFKGRFSFILLMTTVPGQSGGAFNKAVFKRIREFREKYPNKAIHVDGGVTDDVSYILKKMGVNLIVVGSYLEKTTSAINSTLSIRGLPSETSAFQVRDFMRFPKEFPTLQEKAFTITTLLKEMSSRKSGFAIVVNEAFELTGFITDGDIRRAWLKSIETGKDVDAIDIMNPHPVTILDTETVGEMLEKICSLQQSCLYFPVVNAKKILQGAISFQDMIRGEL